MIPLAIFGAVCVLLILVAIACSAFSYAVQSWKERQISAIHLMRQDASRFIGWEMSHNSHWFSSNEVAMLAIQAVGDQLARDKQINMERARKDWELLVKKAKGQ